MTRTPRKTKKKWKDEALAKFEALFYYLAIRLPPELRTVESITNVMFKCDMEAYRTLGRPILVHMSWVKTATGVEPAFQQWKQ